MNSTTSRRRLLRMAGLGAAFLALVAFSSFAAQAHERKNHGHKPHHHPRHGAVVAVVPSPPPHPPVAMYQGHRHHGSRFVVPSRIIAVRDIDYYQPYFVRRYYHAPGRCWRSIYNFPVYTSVGVEYRPYLYEEGRLVIGARFGSPGFNFGFTWVGN